MGWKAQLVLSQREDGLQAKERRWRRRRRQKMGCFRACIKAAESSPPPTPSTNAASVSAAFVRRCHPRIAVASSCCSCTGIIGDVPMLNHAAAIQYSRTEESRAGNFPDSQLTDVVLCSRLSRSGAGATSINGCYSIDTDRYAAHIAALIAI